MLPRVMNLVIFNSLLLASCAYALVKGGAPERSGALIALVASALTMAVNLPILKPFANVELEFVLVDVGVFAAFTMLAIRSNRFWPIWAAAFAGLGLLGHFARLHVGAGISDWAYAVSLTIWSYPTLIALAVGTFNHRRCLGNASAHVA